MLLYLLLAMAGGGEEVGETALQEVSRFELQRSVSTASSTTHDDTAQQHKVEGEHTCHSNTLCTYVLQEDRGHKHMSTKQRRYIAPNSM